MIKTLETRMNILENLYTQVHDYYLWQTTDLKWSVTVRRLQEKYNDAVRKYCNALNQEFSYLTRAL